MVLTLPYDSATEDAILGAVIMYPEEYENVSKYLSNDEVFYQDKARLLWRKLKRMKRAKEKIDMVTVASALNDKETKKGLTAHYVSICYSAAPAGGAASYYANQLYEKYILRKVVVNSEEIKEKANSNHMDVYDVINQAHSLYGELLDIRPSKIQDIEDVISDTLLSIKNKSTKLITTGYDNMDKWSGGLTRGEITIIGGRPGHGKTTVMINMLAKALEQGQRAMFFSRELPNSELMKKIICLESGKLSYGMVRKNIFSDDSLKIVNETIDSIREKYSKENFLMFDNLKDFSSSSSEVKRFKPDIIFDDYIQLVSCEGYRSERRLQIEKLVNDYKWLAKENDCVVV